MTSKEMIDVATGFREGILEGRSSKYMCYAVAAALEGYLAAIGEDTKLVEGEVKGMQHYWLALEDGRILDPTADQFGLPAVYLGVKPKWYQLLRADS